VKNIETSAELREEINKILANSSALCTNFFLSADDIDEAAAKGEFFVHPFDGGILIFRQREGYYRTYFYLSDPGKIVFMPMEYPAVLEIAYRDRDISMKNIIGEFEQAGFESLFSRIRMTRRGELFSKTGNAESAAERDAETIRAIFRECFHPAAGCIPNDSELMAEIAAGHILTDDTVSGLLHFTESRTGSELRHLAVTETMRNRGIGSMLVESYLSRFGEKKAVVWVRDDNEPAVHTYEKYGFKADGMKSAVLIYENTDVKNRGKMK